MKLHTRELRSGHGAPIVLLHGWMGSGQDFDAMAQSDAFDGRTLIAVDLPAHGDSPDYDREYDFADVAQWVVDEVGSEPVDLVGYSMGGRVALYIAGTQPRRIRRLALVGAHPGIEHPLRQRERLELDAERASALINDPAGFLGSWSELELFGPAGSPAWTALRERRLATFETHAFGWSRALLCLSVGRQLSLWNVPYGLELPTLYIAGSEDESYVGVAAELVAQNAAFVSVGFVAGAHHAAHLDHPEDVARRLAEFVSP